MRMRNGIKMAAAGTLMLAAAAFGGDKKNVIETVMKKSMKGDSSLIKKAVKGSATDAEKKQLLEYVTQLTGTKPPVGDQADWDKRIKALVDATQDLVANKDGAAAKLKTASNCKSCHEAHKED